jgi:hypothetical protein
MYVKKEEKKNIFKNNFLTLFLFTIIFAIVITMDIIFLSKDSNTIGVIGQIFFFLYLIAEIFILCALIYTFSKKSN